MAAFWEYTVDKKPKGMTLNQLADKDDIEKITRSINPSMNGFEDRKLRLARAKAALNIPPVP